MQVVVRDAGDLKRLARDLREVADGRELRKELTGGIRGVLRPLVPRVRDAYRSAPSRRGGGSQRRNLRALLARSVRVEVRTAGKLAGARIRADGRRMPDTLKAIPRYWEGPAVHGWSGRWRHPLFGNRDVWVQQESHPTFYRTLEPHTDDAGRAIDKVLEDVRDKLERAR